MVAGIAYVKKRLYNPELIIDPNEIFGPNGWFLRANDPNGKFNPIYEIHWTGTTQAAEELGTAATSVKDGTTTPFLVNIVSSDVADDWDNLAGAVRSVALIGITTSSLADYLQWQLDPTSVAGERGRPRTTVEVVKTNGTADVVATRYNVWLDGIYACQWGTGATDATGNIDAESPTGTVLIRIAATQNEGEGGVWHFPPGKDLETLHVALTPTATFAAGDGVVLTGTFTSFDQSNNSDPDLNVDYFAYTSAGGSVAHGEVGIELPRKTTINSKVLWSEALIANAIVYDIHIIQGMH